MTIKTELKQLEKNKVELNIKVKADKLKEAIGRAYKDVSSKAKIPGFRKGKVPAKVIDNYFGKGYVMQKALETDLPNYYAQAVHDTNIKPIASPDIEIVEFEENKDLKFKAKVEVEPEVKLPDFKDITVEHKKQKVKKEEVDAQIENIRNRFAEIKTVVGKIADTGNHVLINFDGTIDGKEFEGSSAKNFLLEIGSNTLMPEFENQLIGTKAGDIKQITLNIASEHPNKEIAGKVAEFKVLIKEIKVKELPELNDKFAKDIVGIESIEKLKSEIKKDMQKALDRQATDQYRLALLQEFAKKAEVEIPEAMIESTTKEMMKEFEITLKNQGTTVENYLKANNMIEEDMKKNLRKTAVERTREELAIKALIESEKISVNDKDLEKKIEELSEGKDKSQTRKELEEKDLIGYLKSNMLFSKAIDVLEAKIKKEAKSK